MIAFLTGIFAKFDLKWIAILLTTLVVLFGSWVIYDAVRDSAALKVQLEHLNKQYIEQTETMNRIIADNERIRSITEENHKEVSRIKEETIETLQSLEKEEGGDSSNVLKEALKKIGK